MRKLTTIILMLFATSAAGQKENSPFQKFGKITAKDFQTTKYAFDTSANAVILSDIGNYSIRGNTTGGFDLVFDKHTVIHILNKNGYDEASISVPLYVPRNAEESMSGFRAATYNYENGKVTETKLPRSQLIKEKVDDTRALYKFTMPQLREGSIIEYAYQIKSEYISVPDPWYFQSTSAATLWSEMNFDVPQFFNYLANHTGHFPLSKSEETSKKEIFDLMNTRGSMSTERASVTSLVTTYRFVCKEVPQLKTEPFTRSVRNHLARMNFQLAGQRYPLQDKTFRSTWQEVTRSLLESERFGKHLSANNNWLRDELRPIIKSETDPLLKAQQIFRYVRDEFKTTENSSILMSDNLRSVFKGRKGSASELNILLTAMFRYADLMSDPVLLSTTDHGYLSKHAPMLSNLNYVISKVTVDGKEYYLDASHSFLGFNKLPPKCYNDFAVVANLDATAVQLSPDSVLEGRQVFFILANTDNGYAGSVRKREGYYRSLAIREAITQKGKDEFFDELAKVFPTYVTPQNFDIQYLEDYEGSLELSYDLTFNSNSEQLMYVNPFFGENYSRNPFAAGDRRYLVEMPYLQDELIVATIQIPEGYEVDELPKQVTVTLDKTGTTFFKYLLTQDAAKINLQCQIKIGKTRFMPEEYELLREFFNLITTKQSEPIVFKKSAE